MTLQHELLGTDYASFRMLCEIVYNARGTITVVMNGAANSFTIVQRSIKHRLFQLIIFLIFIFPSDDQ